MSGMLKRPAVHVSVLARSLEEKIAPKKTEERLHHTLRREGIGRRIPEANAEKNRMAVRENRFCIIDLSDIQKLYAAKMEVLGRVRDGDRSDRGNALAGNGLYWINGVMADERCILPVYSELCGLDYEGRGHTSENAKILLITDLVQRLHPDATYVLDRGGDRPVILDAFIKDGKAFVVRGQNQRSLKMHRDSTKKTNIMKIAKKVKPAHAYKSLRNGERFDIGLRRVYYGKTPLWLVVSKRRRNGGLSWYLTNGDGTRVHIMKTVMEAYGYRWRVEEYHRQIKQDYCLEKISLRKYDAIKSMGALVALAASFCARLPEHLMIRMVAAAGLLPRKRLGDIPSYPYYMLTAAVAQVLGQSRRQQPKPLRVRKRDYLQLSLALQGG